MSRWWRFFAASLFICASLVSFRATAPVVGAAPATGVTLRGSIVDTSLTPLAGVSVTLQRGRATVGTAVTDANGVFALTGLAAGVYTLRAEKHGFVLVARSLTIRPRSGVEQLPIVLMRVGEAPPPRAVPGSDDASFSNPMVGASSSSAGRGGGLAGWLLGGTTASAPIAMPPPLAAPAPEARWPNPPPYRAWPTPSTADYAPIDPNRFQSTRAHPLSTFGADVDTASYTNVRRFLSSGQLPPPDAVRVEELVNYFRFDYPAPTDGQPIGLTTEVGDCPWAPSHKLVLVGARAAAPPADDRGGRNLVLLIDVSGSMEPPERLPLIKSALGLFVNTLNPDDHVAIVTYAGTSGVALPSTPVRERSVIQDAIAGLQAGGSTNGGQGLILAYRLAVESYVPGGVNRVVLATDGDFNVGIVSHDDLLHLIERERNSGVFLSVFGVGDDNLKDSTMEMLADHGNGNYAYLDSLQEAERVLVREGDSTIDAVAKDVKFQVEFNPAAIGAWKLIGYEDRALAARDFNDDTKDAGEMGAGHTVTVLYEVIPLAGMTAAERGAIDRPEVDPLRYQPQAAAPPQPAAEPMHPDEWLTVKARYKLPDEDTSRLIARAVRPGGPAPHLTFAAAVAEFGLILRDAPHDTARWDALTRRIASLEVPASRTADKRDLADLVTLASGLARLR